MLLLDSTTGKPNIPSQNQVYYLNHEHSEMIHGYPQKMPLPPTPTVPLIEKLHPRLKSSIPKVLSLKPPLTLFSSLIILLVFYFLKVSICFTRILPEYPAP
jgi:hypothetical protein